MSPVHIQVRCRCNVKRTIDTSKVGAWRLRCKQCGDVLYDPSAPAPAQQAQPKARPPKPKPKRRRAPQPQAAAPPEPRPQPEPRAEEYPEPIRRQQNPIDEGRERFPQLHGAPLLALDDDGVEDSQFQKWLHGSGELQVMVSTDGTEAPRCPRHPERRIVAACTRCSKLLCRYCLDRIEDEFVCSECVERVAIEADPKQGTLMMWFKRLFGAK